MKTFVITYPNGSIELNVNNYFVKATLPSIKKMFKFARLHCNENQRSELLQALKRSKKYWDETSRKIYSLNYTNNRIIHMLSPRTEKQRCDLQAKLNRVIEILNAEKWEEVAL